MVRVYNVRFKNRRCGTLRNKKLVWSDRLHVITFYIRSGAENVTRFNVYKTINLLRISSSTLYCFVYYVPGRSTKQARRTPIRPEVCIQPPCHSQGNFRQHTLGIDESLILAWYRFHCVLLSIFFPLAGSRGSRSARLPEAEGMISPREKALNDCSC